MSIPIDPISIDLSPDTPTALTPEVLGKELNNIGLSCKYTTPRLLSLIMADVERKLPVGKLESFRLLKPTNDPSKRLESFVNDYEISSQGNYSIKDTKFDPLLENIQLPRNFDWLKATDPEFTGIIESTDPDPIQATTVDAIKDFFLKTLTMASSVVLKGINTDTLKSMLSNVMNKLPTDIKDYHDVDSRAIFLVEDYDPNSKTAAAIGVVGISWTLDIQDYKESSNSPVTHKTSLSVTARGVMYADVSQIEADNKKINDHFNNAAFNQFSIPIPSDNEVKIFDAQPPANIDTFGKGLPLTSKTTYIDHIILFAPDLQAVASIDNTSSSDTATYLKSVSTGFKFSMSQSFSITAGFEVTVEVIKASLSTTFSFGFSEEWSKLTTESINFSVPAGKKGFLYQGTVVSRILRYTPEHNSYVYLDMGQLKTTVFAVRDTPITPGAKVKLVATV